MPEGSSVSQMFGNIASRYDFANHLLSAGFDYYWRYKLISLVKAHNPQKIVDLATGSGDVAFALKKALAKEVQVIGLDFCYPMLTKAESKKKVRAYAKDIVFDYGDCMALPLQDQSVDVVTIAFGFRNLQDRQRGLQEMRRILKPGGRLFILEFTQPASYFINLYYFYLKKILPPLAKFFTGNREAYDYLGDSIEQFPNKEALTVEIAQAGFKEVSAFPMTLSIVALHTAAV